MNIVTLFLVFVFAFQLKAQTPATPSTPDGANTAPAQAPAPAPQESANKPKPKPSRPQVNLSTPMGDGKTTYDEKSAPDIKTEEITISDKNQLKKRIRSMFAVFDIEYVIGKTKKTGRFKFKLYKNRAPETVDNFVALVEGEKEFKDPVTEKKVKRPFYDGLLFHRVARGFIMQTGDPKSNGSGGGPGYNIPLEINGNLIHDRFGVVSMARMGNESHGSQFFITFAPLPHLDKVNAVFGQVVDSNSVKVLEEIERVKTDRTERPKYPVKILKATIERI